MIHITSMWNPFPPSLLLSCSKNFPWLFIAFSPDYHSLQRKNNCFPIVAQASGTCRFFLFMFPLLNYSFQSSDFTLTSFLFNQSRLGVFLKYNLFTMLYQFLFYSKVTQLYINLHFFIFFSIIVYPRILTVVPCAIQ